jgi:hypothetical protein
MNPYARPNERKVGARRPKVEHVDGRVEPRSRKDRQAQKQAVDDERRAIKKSARRHLENELRDELAGLSR